MCELYRSQPDVVLTGADSSRYLVSNCGSCSNSTQTAYIGSYNHYIK